MKKLILLLFIVVQNLYSQEQYIGLFADLRNATIGSDATIKTPSLDVLILGGVTDKNGITVEVGYENFNKIEFSKIYFGVGYTCTVFSDNFNLTTTIEPTYITRKWGGWYGTRTYSSLGGSLRLSYNINDDFNISLLNNILKRYDNADRYRIEAPLIYSLYLGLIYNFNL